MEPEFVDLTLPATPTAIANNNVYRNHVNSSSHQTQPSPICLSDDDDDDQVNAADTSVIIVDGDRGPSSVMPLSQNQEVVIIGSSVNNVQEELMSSDEVDYDSAADDDEDSDVEVLSQSESSGLGHSSPEEMEPNDDYSNDRNDFRRIQETIDRNVALQLQREEQQHRQQQQNNRRLPVTWQHGSNPDFADIRERLLQRINRLNSNAGYSQYQLETASSLLFNNNSFRPQHHQQQQSRQRHHQQSHAGGRFHLSETPSYEELLALEERMGSVKVGLSDSDISRLPVFAFTHQHLLRNSSSSSSNINSNNGNQNSGSGEEMSCPICLLEFDVGDTVMLLNPCMHRFHEECCKKWLRENKKCPICREQVVVSAAGFDGDDSDLRNFV